jgi:DUF971 family protein
MNPTDLTPFPSELAVRWSDGSENFITYENLRRFCPCAGCMGEQDIFGTTYQAPVRPYTEQSFQLLRLVPVGGYAIQPHWADGHNTGLFTWEWLRRIAAAQAAPATESE